MKGNTRIILTIAGIFAVILLVAILRMTTFVSTEFATEVTLNGNIKVHDEADIATLKMLLKGMSYQDSPSCGFSLTPSVTFTDGEKTVTLYIAHDSCDIAQVGETDRYVTIVDREALDAVFAKYGITLPYLT